jgi:galactose mutarotase-like enzyme
VLRFRDEDVNYFWRPPELDKLGHAICFPLLGGFAGDAYELYGKTYIMKQHGFANEYEYEAVEQSESEITYELRDNEDTLRQYPYHFRLRVIYSLDGAALQTRYCVKNLDDKEMYFSVGGHPRYACPIGAGNFEDCYLEFEKPESIDNIVKHYEPLSVIKECFGDGNKTLALKREIFEKGCFCLHPVHSDYVTLKQAKSSRGIQIQTNTLTHLQFWTSADGRFLCMEPWFGSITHIPQGAKEHIWTERPGTLRLLPGEERVCSYKVEIKR